MYEELIAVLRHCGSLPCEGCPRKTCEGAMANMREAADAIEELSLIAESNGRSAARWAETAGKAIERYEELDRHAITLQHEMMAEAESHIALVERLNKQVEELQKQVAHWQRELVKSMCEVTLIETEKPRWIPVTERLPEEGEFVLVYGDLYPNKHDGGVIAVSKRMDWNYWQGFGRERNITHWRPLPEPPEEEHP